MSTQPIRVRSALISVYNKQGLDDMVATLRAQGVQLYSTGGTADYLRGLGASVIDISDLTGFPSILGGRVKTLHPKVFGGILAVRADATHQQELQQHAIPTFDLVVVDLYPFAETLQSTTEERAIIEKIDIGGISLIRAGAKNFGDVLIVPAQQHYAECTALLKAGNGSTTLADRKRFAGYAFQVSSQYDSLIGGWFTGSTDTPLRYGENPHQTASYRGNLNEVFEKLGGKELSYNNLLDVDSAMRLMAEFDSTCCAIIKHNNPCGVALRPTALAAWQAALQADPTSAFGGIIILNTRIDLATAQAINEIFFEVLLAPAYDDDALALLLTKKNRIVLRYHTLQFGTALRRTALNGELVQHTDVGTSTHTPATTRKPTAEEAQDLRFAEAVAKHLKSNAIVLVRAGQTIGAGMGQTSRVDAVKQAIAKARERSFDTAGAVLASDAFFPFPDSLELAHAAGIQVVLQPGGSVRDEEVREFAERHGMCMVLTGMRHFRH